MKYLVIEIQTISESTVSNLVWAYDTRNEAESKFHAVLAAAALSALPMHTACLLSNDGRLLDRRCYDHRIAAGAEE